MNTSVTKALREVLLELFAYTPKREVYSDVRKGGEAIGVKFVGLELTDDELDQVRHQMEARGFTHHYSRMNAQGNWTTGIRFCYSPRRVEIVEKPKQNKITKVMSTPKMYEVHLKDIMKIHDIACDTWKEIIMNNYISKVHNLKLTYTFFQSDVDTMFKAATEKQIPVLEEVFGKYKNEIDWDKIKTGSKVMIQNTEQWCSGGNINLSLPVDVVFWKTPHLVQGDGKFQIDGYNPSYCTFHQNGNYVLFASQENTDYVIDVVEY